MGLFKDIMKLKKAAKSVNTGIKKIKKPVKPPTETTTASTKLVVSPRRAAPPGTKQYKFYSAWGKPTQGRGKVLQEKLEEIVPKNPNFNLPSAELIKAGMYSVFEYELEGEGVRFIEEPDNVYDKNAVIIEIDGIGYAGYVPRKKQRTVKSYRFGGRKEKLVGVRYFITGGSSRFLYDDPYEDIEDIEDEIDDGDDQYKIRIIFDHYE